MIPNFVTLLHIETVAEIKKVGMTPPKRPIIDKNACTPNLMAILTVCLSETPAKRPDFNSIANRCKSLQA